MLCRFLLFKINRSSDHQIIRFFYLARFIKKRK